MNNLPCELIHDILPLYADGIVSPKTEELVQTHLENCKRCQKEYETMTHELELPANPDLRQENAEALKSIKRALHWKRIAVAAISMLLTLVVVISGYMVFENVGIVHDFFDPSFRADMRQCETGQWQELEFEKIKWDIMDRETDNTEMGGSKINWIAMDWESSDTLKFDSVFYSRKLVNDASSSSGVVVRVLDMEGNVVLKETKIEPGSSISLKTLQRFKEYRVEALAESSDVFLNFC